MKEQKENTPILYKRPEQEEKVYYGEIIPPVKMTSSSDAQRLRDVRYELQTINHTHHHYHITNSEQKEDEADDPYVRAGMIVGESIFVLGSLPIFLLREGWPSRKSAWERNRIIRFRERSPVSLRPRSRRVGVQTS